MLLSPINTDAALFAAVRYTIMLLATSLRNNHQPQFCYTLEYSAVIIMVLAHFLKTNHAINPYF